MSIRFIRTLVVGLVVLVMSAAAFAQVGLMITIAPPPLPVYEQPVCPEEGYIWTPGFWAYDSDIDDYYWVPGTWVLAPEVGYLWTPAYWGWGGDRFVFYDGYWGPLVGFYGGINYGFGYFGVGFEGGRWDNGHFFYNRAVNNVDVTIIHNVYVTNVENNRTENRVSYNGGEGGLNARPTPQQEAAARERHLPPVAAQTQHMQEARSNPQQRASVNRGKPEVAATPKPGAYKDRGVVQAKAAGGAYNPATNRGNRGANQGPDNRAAGGRPENNPGTPPENRPENNTNARVGGNAAGSTTYNHVRELPPPERPAPYSTGNAKQDQKYQQQQEKLYAQQQKERQTIAQQQEKEDQRVARQNNEQAKQQTEQRHQQQTQQLQQRHQQQQQQMQQRQAPRQQSEPGRKPPK
jgi:WXXGXW repeat (2 copies)